MDVCPVCLDQKEIIRFGMCSHGVCEECTELLQKFEIQRCPICRQDFENLDLSEPDVVIRRRRRNLSRIEHIKRKQIIKARQRRSRSKKDVRNRKLHGNNYY